MVHLAAPVESVERDEEGMYVKAEAGEIENFRLSCRLRTTS